MMSPYQRFWQLLKPNKKEIYQVYSFALLKGILALSIPLGIQSIINLIQGGSISTSWILLSVLIGLAIGLNGYMQLMQMRIMENIQQTIFTNTAFDFTDRVPKISQKALQQHFAPELMNRFFEILSIQKSLSKIIIDFSSAILQITFGLILLSVYHTFFIVFSILLVLILLLIIRLTSKKALSSSLKESKFKYKIVSWLEELARAKDSFKMAGTTDLPRQKTDERVIGYLNSREEHYQVLRIQYAFLLFFKIAVALGLLFVGGILVIKQQMNIGQFVAAEIVILLVIESTEKIIMSMESVYDAFTSLEKIGQLSEFELDDDIPATVDNFSPKDPIDIQVQNISFSYQENQEPIIRGFSYHFKSGKKVAISGDNGSGKSTLLHLIAGLYKPNQGKILVNDLPIGQFNRSQFYDMTGNGLREETVFEGTLLENITLGRSISQDHVFYVLNKLHLNEFIQELSMGVHQLIDPMGKKLPRSVVQKIILARSIVNQPKLLLLENTLDAIEPQERKNIIEYLCDKQQPWTLIIISEDPLLQQYCDEVIRMKKGSLSTQV